jgi:Fe2+ or Zn2+ uptake regulation protein
MLQSASDKVNFTLQRQCLELFGLCPQCCEHQETANNE